MRDGATAKSNPSPHPPSAASVRMHIHQSGRSEKTKNAKNTKKSTIHENADANITCEFGDISRFRSRLPHTDRQTASHIVSSIIVKLTTMEESAFLWKKTYSWVNIITVLTVNTPDADPWSYETDGFRWWLIFEYAWYFLMVHRFSWHIQRFCTTTVVTCPL